jgi:hypothetical protein
MVGLGVAEHVEHAAPVSAFSRTGEKVEEYAESRGASFPSR